MKTRKHMLAIVMVLLLPGLLWSQEAPERKGTSRMSQPTRLEPVSETSRDVQIFPLRNQRAAELAETIRVLVSSREATIAVDQPTNTLIVAAPPDRMTQIEQVIAQLDVAVVTPSDVPQMLYRIYMLELPVEHQNLKPFSMTLEGTGQIPPAQLLGMGQDAEIQIDSLHQEPEDERWPKWELTITGRAPSTAAIKKMIEKIPDAKLWRWQWHNDTLAPPAARVAPLPNELNKHLQQLLGPDIRTVGYWFGNLSAPGTVQAPIGPWVFEMQVNELSKDNEVELEIAVLREAPPNADKTWRILGNSVRTDITKPVIIGYNREVHGTRTMGALVIVPQEDPLPRRRR